MALTFTRTLLTPVVDQEPTAGSSYTSAEQDLGDGAIAEQIWLYVAVAGFAAAPGGNEQQLVEIHPVHTTAGTAFSDQPVQYAFETAADQAYNFAIPLPSLPRFFKVKITNDTGQNIDTNGLDAWIEYIKVDD